MVFGHFLSIDVKTNITIHFLINSNLFGATIIVLILLIAGTVRKMYEIYDSFLFRNKSMWGI